MEDLTLLMESTSFFFLGVFVICLGMSRCLDVSTWLWAWGLNVLLTPLFLNFCREDPTLLSLFRKLWTECQWWLCTLGFTWAYDCFFLFSMLFCKESETVSLVWLLAALTLVAAVWEALSPFFLVDFVRVLESLLSLDL